MSTSLPALPALPSLSTRPQIKLAPANIFSGGAPSGIGWGFTPDQGWEGDFSGGGGSFGIGPAPDIFGGGQDIFGDIFSGGNNSGGGLTTVGGVPTISIGGGGGSTVSVKNSGTSSSVGFLGLPGLPSINWGRIGAFLLGLLLIAGGLFLIKPVQQAVKITVKSGSKYLADSAAA